MKYQMAILLLSGLFASGSDPTKDSVSKELEKLKGTWMLIGGEEKGRVRTEEAVQRAKQRVVINGNKLILIQGDTEGHCTIRLDPSKKPAWMDLLMTDNEGEIHINHAIYSLEGDRLIICVSRKYGSNSPEQRPIKLTSNPKENKDLLGLVLTIYARKKD